MAAQLVPSWKMLWGTTPTVESMVTSCRRLTWSELTRSVKEAAHKAQGRPTEGGLGPVEEGGAEGGEVLRVEREEEGGRRGGKKAGVRGALGGDGEEELAAIDGRTGAAGSSGGPRRAARS